MASYLRKLKYFLSLLLIGMVTIPTFSQNDITISAIGPQQVVAGGHIKVFFSGVNKVNNVISFTADNLPSFVTILDNGDNSGVFLVNAGSTDAGTYDFHLLASSGSRSSDILVKLNVLSPIGQIYHCDPINGSISNSGSEDSPWSTLEAVFENNKSFESGDVIFLHDGQHGFPLVRGFQDEDAYISALSGHNPTLTKLSFGSGRNWVISGLMISPETAGLVDNGLYVNLSQTASYITLENCEIFGVKNTDVYSTNQQWYDNIGNGIDCYAKNTVIRNNFIFNTNFSLQVFREKVDFAYNTIDRYGADAIRGLASNTSYRYNVIKNPTVDDYDTGNHDDAWQSWTFGNPIENIEIIGNQIYSATDPSIPLLTEIMQGIVIFDGFCKGWDVSNNLVVTDHPHAIALYGSTNCKVVNNTVVKNPLNLHSFGALPWIRINPHKNSKVSTGNLVRNNIAATYQHDNKEPGSADHNILISTYNNLLVDYSNWNFKLKSGSSAIGSGLAEDAPTIDIDGRLRINNPMDIGCYAFTGDILDDNPPSTPIDLSVVEATPSSLLIDWEDSTDDHGVSFYTIMYEGKELSSESSEVLVTRLISNNEYSITIKAHDFAGNESQWSEPIEGNTLENEGSMEVHFVQGSASDQLIKSNKKLMWVGMPTHQVGGAYSNGDASATIPFILPVRRQGKKVVDAEFIYDLIKINGQPQGNVDLYGLPYREEEDVKQNDHWQGEYASGPDSDTPIQSDFISANNSLGSNSLGASGRTSLVNYLNNQYDNGAKKNDHVFLRLNSNRTNEGSGSYYQLSSCDAPVSTKRPLLKIITKLTTSISPVEIENGIRLLNNPIQNNTITFELHGFESTTSVKILIHDGTGKLIVSKHHDIQGDKDRLHIYNQGINNGVYFITVLGHDKYAESKVVAF